MNFLSVAILLHRAKNEPASEPVCGIELNVDMNCREFKLGYAHKLK